MLDRLAILCRRDACTTKIRELPKSRAAEVPPFALSDATAFVVGTEFGADNA
jgi:hypothetical protein